jgi:uncharacterized Zn finger protein
VSRSPDPMARGRQLADDGHVRIIARDPRHVRATVRSGTDPDRTWRVTFDGWSCDCPATRTCSHVQAVRIIIGARDLDARPSGRWWNTRATNPTSRGERP